MSIRESILSIGSRMAQRYSEDYHFDVMTYEELQNLEKEIWKRRWMLTMENEVYERYLTRQDPQIIKTIAFLLERAKIARRLTSRLLSRTSGMSFRESIINTQEDIRKSSIVSTPSLMSLMSGSRSHVGVSTAMVSKSIAESARIPVTHRITMAYKEIEEMKKEFSNMQDSSTRKRVFMRAEIEELEIRLSETMEASVDFRRQVIIKGVDPITGKIPAEKVVRFIGNWLRSVDKIIDRLRLKSATTRMQIRKTRQQLIQREDLGESLHAVDFQELNIQNQDFVKMIEEKNRYVHGMKKIAGHYHLKLTQHKQKLSDLTLKLNGVMDEITLREQQIMQLKSDRVEVINDVERLNHRLIRFLDFMDDYRAPEVLDFVKLQKEIQDLQRTQKLLIRRRDIEKILLKSYKKRIQHEREQDELSWMDDIAKPTTS